MRLYPTTQELNPLQKTSKQVSKKPTVYQNTTRQRDIAKPPKPTHQTPTYKSHDAQSNKERGSSQARQTLYETPPEHHVTHTSLKTTNPENKHPTPQISKRTIHRTMTPHPTSPSEENSRIKRIKTRKPPPNQHNNIPLTTIQDPVNQRTPPPMRRERTSHPRTAL